MKRLLAGAMVIAMLLSGVVLPAGASPEEDLKPRAKPEMMAALDAALAVSPPPNFDEILIPSPEGAQAYAMGVLAAEGTPERLAAVLDDLDAGRDVSTRDYVMAGALLHYAGPGYSGDALSALARRVVDAALPLRLEATALPAGSDVALPEVPDVEAVAPSSFGDVNVLATTGRILRVDDLQVSSSQLLDYDATMTSASYSSSYGAYGSYYSYSYSDWYYYYYSSSYYSGQWYNTWGSTSQVVENLLRYRSHFERWEFTAGVNVQVFEQTADAGPSECVEAAAVAECVEAAGTAHMLYTVVTPYAFIDHWWLMVFLEDLARQYYNSWYSSSWGYWYQGYYYSSTYGYSSGSWGDYYSSYYGQSYATSYHASFFASTGGYERIPVPDVKALRDVQITVYAPLDQYVALARGDDTVVDLGTATTMELPNQVGVEYKDTKVSELIATTPHLSDLRIAIDEEPYLSTGLTAVDEAVLTADGVVFAVTGAAGAAAPIAADPASFAQATAAALEAAAGAAAGDAQALVITVQADPAGFAQGEVDGALAAAGAAVAAAAQAAADLEGTLQQGVTVEVPGVEDAVYLVAAYASSELRTGQTGGAGFGLLSVGAYPADSDPVVVRVDAEGLGLPVIFRVDLQDGTAVPNEVTVTAPAVPASGSPEGTVGEAERLADYERMEQALLAMPFETSLPAFLAKERILDDPAGWAKARLQDTMTPESLASTLLRMGATTPERPVLQADLVEATTVLWYAGAGYESDPVFGAWAREILAAALPGYIAAGGALGPTVAVAEPGVPAEAQQLADEAGAVAEGVLAEADAALAPTVDAATQAKLDNLRASAIAGAALKVDTIVNNVREESISTSVFSGWSTYDYYSSYYSYYSSYSAWGGYYSEAASYYNSYGYSYTYDVQRYTQLLQLYSRNDFVNSVTAAMVVLGGTQQVTAEAASPDPAVPGASVDQAALDGDVVYTLLFPFRFNTNWFLSTVLETYQRDYLNNYYGYSSYYDYYASNWYYYYYSSSSSGYGSYGYTYTQTNFRVNGATEIVPVPNAVVSAGAEVVAYVPLKEYALMTRGPAPFDMDTVFQGALPLQVPVTREGAFFGDNLVLSPAPNDLNIVVDEDLLLAGPGATAAQAELQAVTTAEELDARLAAIAADPAAALLGMVPAVDPAAVAASLEQQVQGAIAMVPGPAQAQALAEGTAAAALDIVADPQAFADAAVADVRATTVEVEGQDVPSNVDDRAMYEAVFQADSLVSFRPGVVAVGVMGLDGATVLDPEGIVVAIRAQGLQGNTGLNPTGPMVLRFAADLNGQGPTPAETPSASANVGETVDEVATAVPPAPAAAPVPAPAATDAAVVARPA